MFVHRENLMHGIIMRDDMQQVKVNLCVDSCDSSLCICTLHLCSSSTNHFPVPLQVLMPNATATAVM